MVRHCLPATVARLMGGVRHVVGASVAMIALTSAAVPQDRAPWAEAAVIDLLTDVEATLRSARSESRLIGEFSNILERRLDLGALGRSVAGPEVWDAMTTRQRSSFEDVLLNSMAATYARALAGDGRQPDRLFDVGEAVATDSRCASVPGAFHAVPTGMDVEVASQFAIDVCRTRDGRYGLQNIVLEGVSLLDAQASIFAEALETARGDVRVVLRAFR